MNRFSPRRCFSSLGTAILLAVLTFTFSAPEALAQGGPGTYWLQSQGLQFWEWDIDHDGDLFSARQEYYSGTDPFDSMSKLEFNITPQPPDVILDWDSILGATYQMLGSPDMIIPFTPILGPVPGDGFNIQVTLTPAEQGTAMFFCLEALEPIDEDNDGLSLIEEIMIGTDPLISDTDRDSILDGDEVLTYLSDPLSAVIMGGTIRGTLLTDPNNDGDLADGAPVEEATVYLDANYNGRLDPGERTETTDIDGDYEFILVPPGVHHVRQDLPAPNIQTFPADALAVTFDMLPDEVHDYTHAANGVGNFDVPYGENPSDWPANWGAVETSGGNAEIVPSVDLVLKPIGVRNRVPAIQTRRGSEFLSLPTGANITLRFDEVIIDGPGPDFLIYAINGAAASEEIEVLVGPTATSLTSIGIFPQSLATIPVDLGTFGIPGPVQFVKCISQNNGGAWFGFDFVGMETINIAAPDPGAHIVVVTSMEIFNDRDFGRYFRDLPPTVILSAADDVPGTIGFRDGESITVQVSAFDDIGLTGVTLEANGQAVTLDANNQATVSLTNPGNILLEATATDTAGQTSADSTQYYVLDASGAFPFDPSRIGQSESNNAAAPRVRILTPGPGTVSSSDVSIIADIIGTPAVTSWTVEIADVNLIDPFNLTAPDSDYVQIASGIGNVYSSPVATVLLSTLPDGIYFVRVCAQNSPTQVTCYGQVIARNVSETDLRPQVTLTSPAPGSSVTMTVDITGTITSTRPLVEWYVEYARADQIDLNNLNADDPDWVRIADGTTTVPVAALLANFDGTTVKNNGYVVRVVARNDIGLGWVEPLALEVTGEAKLGRNRLEFSDLSVELAGFPLQFTRVYDSLQSEEDGELGFGWALDLQDPDIRETVPDTGVLGLFGSTPFRDGTRVYITAPTGERLGFTFKPTVGATSAFGPVYKAVFEPDLGVYHTLEIPEGDLAFLDIDAGGNVFLFVFDFPYNPSRYILTDPEGNRYTYHENKGFLQAEDLNGNKITLNEDGVEHSAGVGLSFGRDGQGRITSVTDPEGNQWLYTYDINGDLETVTDPDSNTTTYTYFTSPAHYLDTITDPQGRMPRRYEYDPLTGRLLAEIDENGNRREATWDPQGFTSTSKNARGDVSFIDFDARGNVTREEDPKGNVTLYEYANAANPDRETKLTDDDGEEWDYQYDAMGRVTRITLPLSAFGNNQFRADYDPFGNMTSLRDTEGHLSTFTYDAQGNRLTEEPFDGPNFTFEHSSEGQPTRRIYEDGYAVIYAYDSNGQLSRQSDNLGFSREMVTLSNGRPQSITEPNGTLDIAFAPGGLLNTQNDKAGNTATLVENPDGSTTRTDRNGRTTKSIFDADERPTGIVLPGGGTAIATYDADGNPDLLTDPLGNTVDYTFDSTNLATAVTDHLGNSDSFAYDAYGNISEVIDRNGKRRTFLYDQNRRLTNERWHNGVGTVIREIVFAYTATNGLDTIDDTVGANTIAHNIGGRLPRPNSVTTTYPGQQVWRTNYTWPPAAPGPSNVNISAVGAGGVQGSVLVDYFAGDVYELRWTRPGAGGGGNRIQIRRNLNGTVDCMRRYTALGGGGPISESFFTYDSLDRVATIRHEDGAGALIDPDAMITYTRDAESRITGITQSSDTSVIAYDLDGQLTSASHTAATYTNETYSYDIGGNRTSSHLTAGPAVVNAPNRLAAIGTLTFLYDNAGNITRRTNTTSGEVTNFSYDHRNRLVLATTHAVLAGPAIDTLEFDYDYLDRMASREINGAKTWILYDRDMPIGEFADGASALSANFFYDPNRLDDVHGVWRATGGEQWLLQDQLGTIRGILDASGALLSWSDYDSFGNLQPGSTPANNEPLRFAGRPYLAELNLYENRRRFYDPRVGRFTQEDPLRFGGGDFNFYRYALNHPTGLTDPTGETAYDYGLALEVFIGAVGAYFDQGGVEAPCQIASWSASNFGYFKGLEELFANPHAFSGGGAPSIERVDLQSETGCTSK